MSDAESQWGCVAVGRSGDVYVDVNESVDDSARWELELSFSDFELRFAIQSREHVSRLHTFLTTGDAIDFVMGHFNSVPIRILRDTEFDDRYFVSATEEEDATLRWTISGSVLADLIAALADAVSDLDT